MGIEIKLDEDTNICEVIKVLSIKKNMSIAQIAKEMTETSGKNVTRFNLSAKLRRNTLTFREITMILKILGHELALNELK